MTAGYKDCERCRRWTAAGCAAVRHREFADEWGETRCTGYRCDVERAYELIGNDERRTQ